MVRVVRTRADIGERDREVLSFAASQQVMLAEQVARLLGAVSAEVDDLLVALVRAGLLIGARVGGEGPGWFRITSAGLEAIGSRASTPGLESRYQHAVGMGWLWLAARAGAFGGADRLLSQREMRAEDEEHGAGAPFAVETDEFGGRPGLHYPDLMLITNSGRVAIELLLAVPAARQLAAVMRAYAADARMGAVLYLTVDPRLGRWVQSLAGSLELSQMVHVSPAVFG